MAAFEYIALNHKGKEEKGVLEADSSRQIRQILRDKGMAPLNVKVARESRSTTSGWRGLFSPSLSVRELSLVTRQLSTLIAAGLTVEESLLAVSRQTENARTQSMLVTVRSKIMEGYSMANSLAEYPRAFPDLYRATVAAGEAAGHLDLVLNRLADYTEKRHDSRQRIFQAMVYPIILFVLTTLILAGLLAYVVPDIVKVFNDTHEQLPILTRFVIAASHFVKDWGLVVLILIGLAVFAVRRALTKPAIRLYYDRRILHLPVLAKLSRGINTSQFASTLSILSASGVPLVDALNISGKVMTNSWLRLKVSEATVKVREGASLNAALDQSGYFPPIMLHMIASGESSGELDNMLSRVATYVQQDVENLLGIMLSLFGPLMLLMMGGAVFVIVIAILLPIINLNELTF